MTRNRRILVGAILVGGAVGAGLVLMGPRRAGADEAATTSPTTSPTTEPAAEDKGVASVQVAPVHVGDFTRTVTMYGSVVPAPGAAVLVSAGIESRVLHLHATIGASVKKGDVLLETEPSPDTKLAMLDARNAIDAAKKNLSDAQQKFDLKLTTNSDLLAVQQAVQTAQLKLDDLQKRGAGEEVKKITAESDATVTKIDAQEGQLIAAGGTLVELLQRGRVEVGAGAEPSAVAGAAADQSVQLFPTSSASSDGIAGKIRLVAEQINPASRLLDVFITPDEKSRLLLGDYVRADLKISSEKTMAVPLSAVLADDDGISVFIVKDSKAAKKPIKVLFQNDKDAAITSEDLRDGDSVVVQGSLELEDGMSVAVEGSK